MPGWILTNVLQQLMPEILNLLYLETHYLILALTARSKVQIWNLNCYNKQQTWLRFTRACSTTSCFQVPQRCVTANQFEDNQQKKIR